MSAFVRTVIRIPAAHFRGGSGEIRDGMSRFVRSLSAITKTNSPGSLNKNTYRRLKGILCTCIGCNYYIIAVGCAHP